MGSVLYRECVAASRGAKWATRIEWMGMDGGVREVEEGVRRKSESTRR